MSQHTVFGDLRQRAIAVYRVKTQSSEYIIGFHEQRGRKFVIVRGAVGTDREHVVVRDSDPRVGDHSMFELPITEWAGHVLEVATMTSSTIESVVAAADPEAVAAVGIEGKVDRSPWERPSGGGFPASASGVAMPAPRGMSESPAIVPLGARGTTPYVDPVGREHAKQVVLGQNPAPAPAASGQPGPPQSQPQVEVPYPTRHVMYAESIVQLLRSISRRDKIFDDLGGNRDLRDRLRHALDESALLLEQIRRRDRK
ncbi:MAG TPA: hypothetical protein VNO30_48875 [Kofleriaceae bacterium]|nr:hypothetical protein [Kofleriaceae bacterium]